MRLHNLSDLLTGAKPDPERCQAVMLALRESGRMPHDIATGCNVDLVTVYNWLLTGDIKDTDRATLAAYLGEPRLL